MRCRFDGLKAPGGPRGSESRGRGIAHLVLVRPMPGVPRTIVAFAVIAAAAAIVIATSTAAQTFTFPPGAQNGGVAIYAPAPVYPAGARARAARGVGVYVMRVEIKSGRVKG